MPAMLEAQVPPGMVAGSQFVVRAPDGNSILVTLPPGLSVGDKFHVAIPDAAPPAAYGPRLPVCLCPRLHFLPIVKRLNPLREEEKSPRRQKAPALKSFRAKMPQHQKRPNDLQ